MLDSLSSSTPAAQEQSPDAAPRPLLFFIRSALLCMLLCLGGVWLYVQHAQRQLAAELEREGGERLALYAGTLHSALNKYSYLPYVLATHPSMQRLLRQQDNAQQANLFLQDMNRAAGSMELFVLNKEGRAVGTSNFDEEGSFLYQDYSYRPYYQHAVNKGTGRYFGVGATTGRPGFFFTRVVQSTGADGEKDILGVAVTKVDLAVLQKEWQAGGETVFITDENGIIFLSSRDEWRYKASRSLPEVVGTAMLYQRQYGNSLPPPLDIRQHRQKGVPALTIAGHTWLYAKRELEPYGWTLWYLRPIQNLEEQGRTLWLMGLGATALVLLCLTLWYVLMGAAKARRAAREALRFRAVNRRLGEEIRRRKSTERDLLTAQADLLHAKHLAILGQMAASVAHELSQPVTSMRLFTSSCRKLAEQAHQPEQKGQPEQGSTPSPMAALTKALAHMMDLVQRLESLIGQLKHFARKAPGAVTAVDLAQSIANALNVLRFSCEEKSCTPEVQCPPGLMVLADAVQLEQVLINLIHNALDAAAAHAAGTGQEPRVTIRAQANGAGISLQVEDNGPGIAEDIREHIFTPFFTTKKSGEGIGLGLAIVEKILRSQGGSIAVEHCQPHGARFKLILPAPDGTPVAAPTSSAARPSDAHGPCTGEKLP